MEAAKILQESIKLKGRVAGGMEGRRIDGNCLEFFNSQKLDSLGQSRYTASLKALNALKNQN